MRNLVRHALARHAGFVLVSAALLGGFQFLICAAVSSVNVSGALESILASLPPMLQAMVSTQLFGGLTSQGLLAFGWNHPVSHALGAAVAIMLATQAISGESESGAMELTMSQPISRATYFTAQVLFAAGALAVTSAGGLLGTLLGGRVFGVGGFGAGALARLALNYAALHAAVFGVTLWLSAAAREGARVASAGFLIVLVSYFAQVIGRLWDRASFVLPWTLHDYFAPREILVEGAGVARPVAILAAVSAAGLALAWARFRAKDLP